MDAIDLTETLIGREVERLFSENPAQSNGLCTNPVTGQWYVRGVDPIAPQKEAAYRALLAREWFAFTAPPDATPLPINEYDREDWKRTGRLLDYIIALYARSLDNRYDVKEHPLSPTMSAACSGNMRTSRAAANSPITRELRKLKAFPAARA